MASDKRFTGLLLAGLVLTASAGNLYRGDTSAEVQTDTLTAGPYNSNLLPWAWDDTTAFDGKRSIRIDWDRKERYIVTRNTRPVRRWFDVWHSLRGPELEVGETYTFSFYAKSSPAQFPVELILQSNSGWNFDVKGGTHSKKFVIGQNWARYSYTFEAKFHHRAPIRGYTPIFSFRNSPAGTFWFDAVQMEKGAKATPYQKPSAQIGIQLICGNPYHI